MSAYYNENDPAAAAMLRGLIAAGQIAPGIVDERSIEDVRPDELAGHAQCHFFAGIGIWSLALRQAGIPDDYRVWTGSCPCQPFSSAGSKGGDKDERHLWPVFAKLIEACRPNIVIGEQVASNLITGKRVSLHLQRLWERKADLGVFADWLEEDLSVNLQSLPQRSGADAAPDAQGFNSDPCVTIGSGGKVTSSTKGVGLQFDGGLGSSSAGQRCVPGHGDCFRSDHESRLEHAFTGPDASGSGLHPREHAGGLVRLERRLRDMGREQGDRDESGDYGASARAIKRVSEAIDRELEKEDGGAWLDTLQTDLEGMGYAFGAIAFPASSVGAPHIRDRAYWVANAGHHGLQGRLPGRQDARRGMVNGQAGRDGATVRPCEFCGYSFDVEKLGRYGRPNCEGSGLADLRCNDHRGEINAANHGQPQADRPANQPCGRGGASCQLADTKHNERERCVSGRGLDSGTQGSGAAAEPSGHSAAIGLGHAAGDGCDGIQVLRGDGGASTERQTDRQNLSGQLEGTGFAHDANCLSGCDGKSAGRLDGESPIQTRSGPTNGYWADVDWLWCRDGRWRPVEPGTSPLAHGMPRSMGAMPPELRGLAELAGLSGESLKRAKQYRVQQLKGYGNAINAQAAQAFIEAAFYQTNQPTAQSIRAQAAHKTIAKGMA